MTDGLPRCSVVVPVRNDAGPLDRCLVALGRQRLAPAEVLVVDNGSRDDSVRVAERHGATVLTEPSVGIGAAASRGYDAAAGDVILRLDADSVPPADWISRIADRFASDAGLDALTGPGDFSAVPRRVRPALTGWYWRVYFEGLDRRVGGTPLFGSNLAMRADAWRAVGPVVHRHDPMVHDDLDLSIHLAEAGRRFEFDPALRVGVSVRPLLHPFGMLRRARRAAHTLALHPDPT
jgi:glycosyltransferase involved in cell wall biosynthesis